MTLSERYKNRKTLKEDGGTRSGVGDAPSPQSADPKEKLEELRAEVMSLGKSIKIKSLQNKFGEKLKEINGSITNWSQIDLNDEWNKLSPMLDDILDMSKKIKWGESPVDEDNVPMHISKFKNSGEKIENKIKDFKNKEELKDIFDFLKGEETWFEELLKEMEKSGRSTGPSIIKFANLCKKFHESLSSFVDDFEKRAKLDPTKIIKEVEALIAQTKKSMAALGEFLKKGNYVTDENKEKTLGDILKPAETAGGASAPGAAPAGGGAT